MARTTSDDRALCSIGAASVLGAKVRRVAAAMRKHGVTDQLSVARAKAIKQDRTGAVIAVDGDVFQVAYALKSGEGRTAWYDRLRLIPLGRA